MNGTVMNDGAVTSIVCAVLAVALSVGVVRAGRRGRRAWAAVSGLAAVACALVAVRDLPGPLVNVLLVAVLLVIAAWAAWPWLRRGQRTGYAGRARRGVRGGDRR